MSHTQRLSDAPTRRRIGPWHPESLPNLDDFEPDTNFVVRAAAGSGKTTALVGRIVALVRSGIPIDDCAAITFTRKAASEMKARLYRELRDAERRLRQTASTPESETTRVRQALQTLPQCFIGTIHAFCARLLREHPLTAGLPPDFTAGIDERDRDELREQSWQAYLSEVWDRDPERVRHVAELGLEPDELVHFFGELCRYPDLEVYVDGPTSPPDLDETVDHLRTFVDTWLPALPDDPSDGDSKPGKAATALRTAERFLTYRTLDDPPTKAQFVGLFEGLTKTDRRKSTDTEVRGDLTKSHWNDRDAAEQLDNEGLPQLVQEVVEPALRAWKAYVHRQLVEFARPAVDRFRERRRETGQLTFQDLLLNARSLLRDHPDARRSLQREYPRLLVDEFQDTDPIQAELLFYLASSDPTERDWRKCRPRDGSLFIVGDDKQSIYRFRRADLDVYRTVRETIDGASNGDDVTLTTNFRSVEPLLDWCNDTFGVLFDELDAPYQAPYVNFESAEQDIPQKAVVRQLRVPYVKGASSKRDIAARNAASIAKYIAGSRADSDPLLRGENDRPLVEGEPGDFMILTRMTSRLNIFAEALAEHGIPYTLAGGGDVDASTELYGLVTLLTCVERPRDPVSRIAYLRGPLVGLSDDALYRYKTNGGDFEGDFRLPFDVSEALDPDLASRLRTANDHLRQVRTLLKTLRPAAAIERVVDRLGLMPRARRSDGLGSLHAGRLLRILSDVQQLDADGHSWTEIRDELQQVLDGDRELDGMTLETGSDDAVRLLNVHKAKGLEAPVVILADPYGGRHPKGPDEHVRRDEGDVVLPVYRQHRYRRTLQYAPTRWTTEFEETEAQYQKAEEHRLLYVAATRAEKMLVVSRYRSDRWSQDKGYWAPLYPSLDGAPELEVPDNVPASSGTADEWEEHVGDVNSRKERVSRRSYQTQTVTDATDEVPGSGYGREFGTAVHELLAHAVRRRREIGRAGLPEHLVRTTLDGFDELNRKATADRMLEAFFSGPVWSQVQAAEVTYAELPVSKFSDGSPSEAVLTDGTIDLLYRLNGRWSLVDYKTDRVPPDPDALAEAYRPQLESYVQMWERATGKKIDDLSLWLADAGRRLRL